MHPLPFADQQADRITRHIVATQRAFTNAWRDLLKLQSARAFRRQPEDSADAADERLDPDNGVMGPPGLTAPAEPVAPIGDTPPPRAAEPPKKPAVLAESEAPTACPAEDGQDLGHDEDRGGAACGDGSSQEPAAVEEASADSDSSVASDALDPASGSPPPPSEIRVWIF